MRATAFLTSRRKTPTSCRPTRTDYRQRAAIGVKPKREDPNGNMVVLTAASGEETAYPYSVKGHGLFTYYLLKKLQETQGDVTLGELGSYVSENVRQQSAVINRKPQNPTLTPSSALAESWQDLKLR